MEQKPREPSLEDGDKLRAEREKAIFGAIEEKYKHKGPFVVQEARKAGISPEVINEYALRFIREEIRKGCPEAAHNFMKNMDVASEEDFERIAKEEFEHVLENSPLNAPYIAKIVFGEKSEEYKKSLKRAREIEAREGAENEEDEEFQKQAEKKGFVYLSSNATFEELFRVLDRLSDEMIDEFWSELQDNYDSSNVNFVENLQSDPRKAAKTKVKDVFGEDLDLGIFEFESKKQKP